MVRPASRACRENKKAEVDEAAAVVAGIAVKAANAENVAKVIPPGNVAKAMPLEKAGSVENAEPEGKVAARGPTFPR